MAYRPNITNNITLYLLFSGCDKHSVSYGMGTAKNEVVWKQAELLYLGNEVTERRWKLSYIGNWQFVTNYIIAVIRSKRWSCMGHVERGRIMSHYYKIILRRCEGKRALQRPRRSWKHRTVIKKWILQKQSLQIWSSDWEYGYSEYNRIPKAGDFLSIWSTTRCT